MQGRRPLVVHELGIDADIAAGLDLGGYVPDLAFDGCVGPVVLFANTDDVLIWVCTRGDCAWIRGAG